MWHTAHKNRPFPHRPSAYPPDHYLGGSRWRRFPSSASSSSHATLTIRLSTSPASGRCCVTASGVWEWTGRQGCASPGLPPPHTRYPQPWPSLLPQTPRSSPLPRTSPLFSTPHLFLRPPFPLALTRFHRVTLPFTPALGALSFVSGPFSLTTCPPAFSPSPPWPFSSRGGAAPGLVALTAPPPPPRAPGRSGRLPVTWWREHRGGLGCRAVGLGFRALCFL